MPINVLVGEANDGHAELVESTLMDSGIVKNLYRGRDCREVLAMTGHAWKSHEGATDVPSLILLDCGLPRGGGVGVLRALKRNRRCSWLPVIMMTSAISHQQAEQCRRLGCGAYVTKWTVFLGLHGFVARAKLLADRAMRIAACRMSAGPSHGFRSGTRDMRTISGAAQTYCHGHGLIGKEVDDGFSAP